MTGIVIFIGDMMFKFSSKRQKSIATSTYSSEFVALRHAVEEAIVVRLLLQSIGFPIDGSINVYYDSESVLKNAQVPGNKLKRIHVYISYHTVFEAYSTGLINLFHSTGFDNPVDLFTKSCGRLIFFKNSNRLLVNPLAQKK